MNYGRSISPQDENILEELKDYWRDSVKIDFDIAHEPCIFFDYHGSWNIVYKLSKDGNYKKNRWSYVQDTHNAIRNFIKQQKEISYEQEKKFQEEFNKKRAAGIKED
jgi:hypothetical protein